MQAGIEHTLKVETDLHNNVFNTEENCDQVSGQYLTSCHLIRVSEFKMYMSHRWQLCS